MTNISITLEGIDRAINELNYRKNSVKKRVIEFIRSCYISEDSVSELTSIPSDTIIQSVWDIKENYQKIKSRRRNFSTIKSSINADLKKLSEKGLNPENIIITENNVFDMSQEAKNDLLKSFSGAVQTGNMDINQVAELLKAVTDFLDDFQKETEKGEETTNIIDQVKKILDRITSDVLLEDEDTEEIELDEDEDIEEIELDEDEEIEEIELDENEDIEPEEDKPEIIDDDQLEDIEDIISEDDDNEPEDEDTEEIELDEDEDIEEIELDEDENIEEIELDEDEEIEEIELDENEDIEPEKDEPEIIDDDQLEDIEDITEDELKALEELRQKKELAEQFDDSLGDGEKKFNKYVVVPGGQYTVGTNKTLKSNLELQQFDMPEVYIGVYPVTNALFEIFIDQTGYVTTAEKSGFGRVYYSRFQKHSSGSTWRKKAGSEDVKGACWYQPSGPGSTLHGKRTHPVVQVSVDDALAFASWIGRRIPTEAEWESAARTDLSHKYPWGDRFNPEALNIEQSGFADTTAVDQYDQFANEFKIVDMLGNVMEWTSDTQIPPALPDSPVRYNIAKGGAWNSGNDVTISSRGLFKPGFTSNTIGFRCISEIAL